MNHKEVINILELLESVFHVNSLYMHGIQIWPLLRREIWMHFLKQDKAPDLNQLYKLFNEIDSNDYNYKPRNLHNINQQHSGCSSIISTLNDKLYPANILFWSRYEEHSEEYEEGLIDRIIDPLIFDANDLNISTIKLSATNNIDQKLLDRQMIKSIVVEPDELLNVINNKNILKRFMENINKICTKLQIYISRIKFIIKKGKVSQQETGNLVIFLSLLDKHLPSLNINYDSVSAMAKILSYRADYFDLILEVVKPKVVILAVFYTPESMALIHSCRRQSIPVVDIQHGKQGLFHGMYSHWKCLPDDGYSVLPDYFWVWGEESASNIERTLPQNARKPKTIVGGNRWLARWVNDEQPFHYTDETRELIKDMEKHDKCILITTQPLTNPLPEYLLQAMRDSPKTWLWLIKTHPHQRHNIDNIESRIKAFGVCYFNVNAVSQSPLYPVLKRSDLHITCWSSVAYEALCFGVPTILIDPTAIKLYGEYINRGYFHYADNASAILKAIDELLGKPLQNESPPYIEISNARALEAFKQCLGKSIFQNV